MAKISKAQKKENEKKYLSLLRDLGFVPVKKGVAYHYKDGDWNFYPTTGTYYNDVTHEKGKIDNLRSKCNCVVIERKKSHNANKVIEPRKKHKYCNLDERYLPDWVLAQERQERLKTYFTRRK